MIFNKKKKMATQTKKKLDQQLREVLEQQLNEKQTKLIEAEAENRMLKNEIEKMRAKLEKKEEQLEKDLAELQKKLVEMKHQQNEQQKSNEQMEKMLQTKADAEKEKDDKLKNDHKEMEEKVHKLEEQLDTQKAFQSELEKKLMEQIVTVQTKVDQQKVIIGELEEQQKHQKQKEEKETNVILDQFSKAQNGEKKPLEKMEKQQKKIKALLNFQQNYWDANAYDEKLKIIGDKSLTVHYKGLFGWHFVFAKHPILLNNNSSDIFYFEISAKNMRNLLFFGFAVKQSKILDERFLCEKGTYAHGSIGAILINGRRAKDAKYHYNEGDTVGIGVNSASRQIIFTKNGLRLDSSDFFVAPSFANDSFHPFVSFVNSDDQIEANFGPNFKFDLTTL
ncbi:hypothetical protein niasHT_002451 [Heterodera trifolii]|uniref:B30.2/SPRY domain-containing protein n=1 Tax=Heterodera trifolii TaxID=157864 RepID=A0ABD2LMK5_9BILA